MSGGVDSSVVACLLHRKGFEVVGVFMRNGRMAEQADQHSCCSQYDAFDARRVADKLGVPFYSVNLAEDFNSIIDYFTQEYRSGRTPSPCILCNRYIKFGALHDYMEAVGAEFIATGHYAGVEKRNGRHALLRARDEQKDQTYMLFDLTQEQLSRCMFPLGKMTKEEVRALAREFRLAVADKLDSQELCFIPDGRTNVFLKQALSDHDGSGEIVSTDGRILGRHDGYFQFTIGQRRGLGAFGDKYYVVTIEPETKRVVVGEYDQLLSKTARARSVNWVSIEPPKGDSAFEVTARIRHAHKPAPGILKMQSRDEIVVEFDEPQRSITPGQAIVCYRGDELLCGGWLF